MLRTPRLFAALVLIAASACSSVGQRRAIVDVPDVENAIAIAKLLDGRHDEPPPEGTGWFEVRHGSLPAIVTATHSTRPFREGKYRFSDGGGTAGLAVGLHELCGVSVIFTTYASPSDPNFYDDNEFKRRLGDLISEIKPALLLDIHASHPYRPYEVDIGTMNGKSVLGDKRLTRDLIRAFAGEGLLNVSVDWFAAAKNQTVAKFGSSLDVPTVQLEFSATRTSPGADNLAGHKFAQTLQALVRFLRSRGLCSQTGVIDGQP